MLITPITIISSEVSKFPPVSVYWKELDVYDAIGETNEIYQDEFKAINSIAAVAYIICCSEWLYYFLYNHFEPAEASILEKFIQAEWVWVCDLPRKLPPYYDSDALMVSHSEALEVLEGRSANIVAVEVLFDSIGDGIRCIPNQQTFLHAAFATQVCDYVLPPDCGFKHWRETILIRLKEKFPSDKKDPSLNQISRRIFDTDVDLDDIDHEADCTSLISDGDFEGNPYLPLTEPDPD